jgi:hypothetical protein
MTAVIHPSPLPLYPSEATYQAAYKLVWFIAATLSLPQHNGAPLATVKQLGTRHWRTRDGQLLRTLDEVVRAILSDELDVSLVDTS